MVLQDFNNDGHPDLLFIESPSAGLANTIHVLLGKGDGTFQSTSIDTIAGVNLSSVVAGDFDKDGKLDIAVTDSVAKTVTVFLGDGAGGFTMCASLPTGSNPLAVSCADLDGDGKLDLVFANNSDDSISTYLGKGDGTFTFKSTFSSGSGSPVGLAIGDFDKNGNLDIAVTLNGNAFSVLGGNGDGSFGAPAKVFLPGTNPSAIVTVDFNDDGVLDLIIATDKVLYLRGNGNLVFQTPLALDAQTRPTSIVTADMNNDGHPDLVVGNNFSDSITVFLNDGFSGITSVQNISVMTWPVAIGAVDVNGDGKLDVVTIGGAPFAVFNKSNYQVVLGNGDGTMRGAFTYPFASGSGSGSTFSGVVADFNGDGKPDIAIADALNRITLLLNTGNFKFVLSLPAIPVLGGGNVVAIDVNGDGILDIVTTGTNNNSGVKGITTLIGNGSGGFQSVFTPSQEAASQYIAIGDLNGDGKPDLVYAGGIAVNTIGVMFGNGDGTFQPLLSQNTYHTSEGPSSVALADFNGDGKLDIAIGNGGNGFDSQADIFLGNGQGSFSVVAQHPLLGAFPFRMIAASDLDKDGKVDLIIGNTGNGNPGSVSILMGLGNGTFKPAIVLPLKWRAEALALGDFDADGFLDIVASENGGLVELFSSKGDGTFTAPIQLAAGGGAASLFAADMNDSGANDLVAIGGGAMVLPNTGGTKMSMNSSANPSTFRQQVTLSTNLVPSVPGMPTVTGTVLLKDAGILLGTLTAPGSTSFSNSALNAGTHPISATYSGDSNYFPRSLPMLSQTVNRAATTTALISSAPKSIVGRPIALDAMVTSTAGGLLTGTVSLLDGTNVVSSTLLDASGHGSFHITTPTVGMHSMTAKYSGDANYDLSTSTVSSQSSIDFNITAATRPGRPRRDAGTQGSMTNFQFEVSAFGAEALPIHLGCGALPNGMSCRFASRDFALTGSRMIDASIDFNRAEVAKGLHGRVRRLVSSRIITVEVVANSGPLSKSVFIPVQVQ